MGARLKGHEKSAYEAEIFPWAESVLSRLNRIEFRLRQVEEKERLPLPESYSAADLRGRSNQLPSGMNDAHLKEALMDRLNLLETRIRQLSQELDNSGSSGGGGDSMMTITFPAEEQKPIPYSSSRGEAGWPWRAGSGIYQSQMPKKKAMDPMQAATAEAMDKRAAAFCRNEKKKVDRSRRYKRWFQIGC